MFNVQKCKDCYLHHVFAHIVFRQEHVNGLVTKEITSTSYKIRKNIALSEIRDTVTIHFYCEECTEYDENKRNLIKLPVDQHKGLL